MKRKVIQSAGSTMLISLPYRWAERFGIEKGDEVEVEEQADRLVVRTEKGGTESQLELPLTNLDDSSILHAIQGAYKMGYGEIKLLFSNPETMSFKDDAPVRTSEVIRKVVERLIGIEIMHQRQDSCILHSVSEATSKEFDNVLRRIFLIQLEIIDDISDVFKKKQDLQILDTVDERHDTITRLSMFCLRILNKQGYGDYRKTNILYHIISTLDKITDELKYIARIVSGKKIEESIIPSILENSELLHLYYEYFYKPTPERMREIIKKRRALQKESLELSKKIIGPSTLVIGRINSISDMLLDITEARSAIEYIQ